MSSLIRVTGSAVDRLARPLRSSVRLRFYAVSALLLSLIVALTALSVLPEGSLRDSGNGVVYAAPYAVPQSGSGDRMLELKWPQAVKGKAVDTLRSDLPQ